MIYSANLGSNLIFVKFRYVQTKNVRAHLRLVNVSKLK
jgi:hypothetical protein